MDNDDRSVENNGNANEADVTSEIESLRDRLMRALADSENTRRLSERRVREAQQYAVANFARDLLEVTDNLRRALETGASEREDSSGLLEGVAATDRILTEVLNRHGVSEIDALRQPFDPMKHEAVTATGETDEPPGNVARVLQNGYMLHDRLLRPARVVVAKPQQSPPQARIGDDTFEQKR